MQLSESQLSYDLFDADDSHSVMYLFYFISFELLVILHIKCIHDP